MNPEQREIPRLYLLSLAAGFLVLSGVIAYLAFWWGK